MSRVLDHAVTGIASVDKYHPLLREHLQYIKEMAELAETQGPITAACFSESSGFQKFLDDCVVCHAPGVYSVAYLSPRYCAEILKEVKKFPHTVNDEEPEEAQIPEVVFQNEHPVLFEVFRSFWADAGVTLAKVLLGLDPVNLTTCQAAQYVPTGISRGHWHIDQDSDVTLVVALNDDHKGGGTMVYRGPFAPAVEVPQNETGWAMLFCGKTTQHYGIPVIEGERNLLVHWSEIK
ncbi:hypothetical protein VO98_035 [Pseudomonas phage phiPsa17]|uniref:Fe2OG dioxygenase domain-containing protein n=1 Tax=Pseudomonas phage phiPsa17 TaxID=1629654 RepID=A0A0G2T4H3_9CAUD|nr:hypothetical protein HOQ98_gp07 [Pseudomonas phage phiPsa17]AKG94349.1 hypothetical protein VO98_035 [Pseudomonas phage phiPsa17]